MRVTSLLNAEWNYLILYTNCNLMEIKEIKNAIFNGDTYPMSGIAVLTDKSSREAALFLDSTNLVENFYGSVDYNYGGGRAWRYHGNGINLGWFFQVARKN